MRRGSIPSVAMESVEAAQTPYEVYCHHCRVTFPSETRNCMHCGGRLGGMSVETPFRRRIAVTREDDESAVSPLRRFGGLAVWGLLALSAVISNLCSQQ